MIKICAGIVYVYPQAWMIDCVKNKDYKSGDIIDRKWIVDNHQDNDLYVRVFALDALRVIDSDEPLTIPGFVELQNSGVGFRYIKSSLAVKI